MARFRRYGKSRQLLIASAAGLQNALDLDSARWAATGAPIDSIMLDRVLLEYLDADGDGRILAHELREAISWTLATFADRRGIALGRVELRAEWLDPAGPDYEALSRSLRRLNSRLERAPDAALTLGELREYIAGLQTRPVTPGGILLPEAAAEPELRSFIDDAIAVTGGTPHPSGAIGLRVDQAGAFVAGIDAYVLWQQARPAAFGDATGEVAELVETLRGKIDQYFLLLKVRRMDERLLEGLEPPPADVLDLRDPVRLEEWLEGYPLARLREDETLDLAEALNPRYADDLKRLFALVASPGSPGSDRVLTEPRWHEIEASTEEFLAWSAARPALSYDGITPPLLEQYRAGEELARVSELARTAEETEVALVEKALLYQAGILRVANNFVSFPQLYDASSRAVFEVGSLVMDGRYFHLAVMVDDHAEHMKIAAMSNMYVLYVSVDERSGGSRQEVAVPVTAGTAGNLGVGKRGVFLDINGQECDAEVVALIDNPVSLGEAFWAPFGRLANALTAQIGAIGSTTEKQVTTGAAGGIFAGGNIGSLIAGGGVAVAALGSATAFITGTLAKLAWWKILVAVGAIASAILLPAVFVAALKLRRRDLSAILEASGWAINSRMRLTRRLSRFFTQQPGRRYRAPAILRKRDGA